jgi:hypothetical protein
LSKLLHTGRTVRATSFYSHTHTCQQPQGCSTTQNNCCTLRAGIYKCQTDFSTSWAEASQEQAAHRHTKLVELPRCHQLLRCHLKVQHGPAYGWFYETNVACYCWLLVVFGNNIVFETLVQRIVVCCCCSSQSVLSLSF